ncbi:MAG: F0F1 ATP synthase subunit B [Deltaproteobacteria bacterium]|nr:F0F1 ATP synthase subunit B [Deltaproteobacteria bacterium]
MIKSNRMKSIIKKGWPTALAAVLLVGLYSVALASGDGGPEGAVDSAKIWDLVKRAVNFILLLGILIYVLRKPIKEFFSHRREDIKRTLEDIEAKKESVRLAYLEYEQRLSVLKGERDKIIQEFRLQGEAERARIIAGAKLMAKRIQEQAQNTIKQEISNAKNLLRTEIADLAARTAKDILEREIQPTDHARLIDDFISKVGETN